jgi:hypothetical protein
MKKKEKNKNAREIASLYSYDDLEKIKERAYYIWEQKGRSADSAFQDWIEAERELKAEGLI